jgi:TPR repeat protein
LGGGTRKNPFEASPDSSGGRAGIAAVPAKEQQAREQQPKEQQRAAIESQSEVPLAGAASSRPAQPESTQPPTSDTAAAASRAVPDSTGASNEPSESVAPAGATTVIAQSSQDAAPRPAARAEPKRVSESEVVAAFQQKNYGVALELAEPLARDGCNECQFIMGRLFETGAAGKKDAMVAADWYRKAAEGGNAKARFNLGNLYLAGNGVIKDARSAAEWFHKAAVGGHRVAQFNLGMMYETGEGISRDLTEAIKWYGEAAQSDDADLARDARAAIERLDKPAPRSKRR